MFRPLDQPTGACLALRRDQNTLQPAAGEAGVRAGVGSFGHPDLELELRRREFGYADMCNSWQYQRVFIEWYMVWKECKWLADL